MERGEGGGRSICGIAVAKPAAALASGLAIALAAAFAGGCSTSIQTPLPDLKPASTSLSQAEREKAVDELNKKRATHEQDAEQQIEQSR
jgi:sugar (pentulose or hexulose) kinase